MSKAAAVRILTAGTLVAGTTLAFAAPSQAREIERESAGTCSAGARWELNLEREFGVIDIDFDIEGANPGEQWTIRFTKNGNGAGTRRVVAEPDGDVDASHIVRAARGTNRIGVKATSASGQTCSTTLRI